MVHESGLNISTRELADTWRRRGRSAGTGARTYQVLLILQPAHEA